MANTFEGLKSHRTTAGAASRPATITARKSWTVRAGATTREGDRPGVLQRNVVQQRVHAKGARAKFICVDTHRHALTSRGLRVVEPEHRRRLRPG